MKNNDDNYIYTPVDTLPYSTSSTDEHRVIQTCTEEKLYVVTAARDIVIKRFLDRHVIPKGTVGGVIGESCELINSWIDKGVLCTDGTTLHDSIVTNGSHLVRRGEDLSALRAHISNGHITKTRIYVPDMADTIIHDSVMDNSDVSGIFKGVTVGRSVVLDTILTSYAYGHGLDIQDDIFSIKCSKLRNCSFTSSSGDMIMMDNHNVRFNGCTDIHMHDACHIVDLEVPHGVDYGERAHTQQIVAIRGKKKNWLVVDGKVVRFEQLYAQSLDYKETAVVNLVIAEFLEKLMQQW